jgi:uncharacterized protein YfaS (alpha-2-macroglobulin family)
MPRKSLSKPWVVLSVLVIASLACNIFGPNPTVTPAATPTSAASPTPLPPIAPTVIDFTPVRGDELPIDGPITVYFDAPMDQTSVESAFAIEPKVAGNFEWSDPATVTFQPSETLQRAARYVVTIGTEAHNAAGLALPAPVSFNADTVGFLEVTQVLPAPETQGAEVGSVITVMFNRPVVPLTALADQANLPNPLALEPAMPGQGEWLNTSIYVFRPEGYLSGGTTYTGRVAAGLTDTTGGLLQDGFTWQFTTQAPEVLAADPFFNQADVGLTRPITITFNQPMDRASVEAAFHLQGADGGELPGSFAWTDDSLSVGFDPEGSLPLETELQVSIDATALSAGGGAALPAAFTSFFTTVRPPAILSTDPANGDQSADYRNGFRIYFNSPMDLGTLDPNLQIIPEPTQVYTFWSEFNNSFFIGWDLQPSADYQVTLGGGMRDLYGNAIPAGQTVSFHTRPYDPELYFNSSGLVGTYNAYADTVMYLNSLNVDTAHLALYRVGLDDFLRFTGPNSFSAFESYSPAEDDRVREWDVDVQDSLNERILTRVPVVGESGGTLPEGLYYLALTAPNVQGVQRQLLVVSKVNLSIKSWLDGYLVWATDLNSGQPISGLALNVYNEAGNVMTTATTGDDGTMTGALPARPDLWTPWFVGTGAPGTTETFAIGATDWSRGVDPWDFGYNGEFYPRDLTAYLYTDRPIYRPGQVVFFKAALRAEDDARFSLPDLDAATLIITNDQGEQVYSDTLPLNDLGTLTGEFKLAEEASLGYYNMALTRGDRFLGSLAFSVAEYRKPEFQVAVTSPVTETLQGSTIPVAVDASFFFGGPVSNADVHWSVLSADYLFPYSGPGYYDFYDFDWSSGQPGPVYGTFGRLISEKDGKTDAQGHATLDVPADLSDSKLSQLYTIEATVTDVNGQQVSGRVEVIVHQGQFYIGIRPTEYVGTAGQPSQVEILTLDWHQNPVGNQAVHLVYNDHQWNCALERDPDTGVNAWTCNAKDTEVANEDVTTGADGKATGTFTPPAGGTYQVKATATDGQGHTVTASTILWVASRDFVAWRQDNNDRITLVADRKAYRVGDTAEILIPSPFQGEATALITVERGRVIQHETLRLTNNSTIYRLPITDFFAPDVFVSVLLVKGVDENNPAPSFKMGTVKLSVSPERQAITVTLTPDKEKVGPRDTVNYTLKATDYAGKPVQAEFSLSLVDLAVLSLTPPNSGPILDAFYGERALGVRTGLGLTLNVDRLNVAADQAKGGGGGGEAGFDEVRGNFLDTAYWNAAVTTDAQGEAQVSVTLPDNLTTWRLDARGLSADTLVGQQVVDIVATRDLLIRPLTPRFFVVGDQATLSAVVNNNTDQSIDAAVSVEASGVTLSSPASQNVTVGAHDRAEVTWQVTADDANAADLTFRVEGGGLQDASKPTLGTTPGQLVPIYHYAAPETTGTAGQLDAADTRLEAIGLPRRFDASQGVLDIRLDPSLAAGLTGALDSLEHFPYECTEQTVSRFLPNVLTFRALRELGLTNPELEARLDGLVNEGLQRLYARQHVDGGWGWWQTDASDSFITAYVVFGLVKAQQSGFAISADVLARGTAYLGEHLVRPNETTENWELNRQAFILYTLAEAGRGNTSATVQLYDARQRLDTYARAYLALAFNLLGPGGANRIPALLSDINNAAILSATGAHWEEAAVDFWNMNTDTRSTAVVLDALVKLDPENNLIPNVVRWLMVARKAETWETTQETAWALIGLTDWMVASGELEGSYSYGVTLNGNSLSQGTVDSSSVDEAVTLQVAVADLFKDQANRLEISRGEGPGRLYYTAHLNVYLPVEDVTALNRGITVAREYRLKTHECGGADQPECQVITQASAGQDIEVRVTLIAPNDLYYVVLEDPLPGGAEAVDTSVLTTSVVGEPPQLSPSDPLYYGWGWWWFSNTDLRDEKVVLFATYLPKGTYEYTYMIHASLPGTYKVIPTQAREFYFPEVFGRGDGTIFTINP